MNRLFQSVLEINKKLDDLKSCSKKLAIVITVESIKQAMIGTLGREMVKINRPCLVEALIQKEYVTGTRIGSKNALQSWDSLALIVVRKTMYGDNVLLLGLKSATYAVSKIG